MQMLFNLLNHRNFTLSLPIGTDKERYAPARGASLHKRNELYSKLSESPFTQHTNLYYTTTCTNLLGY